MWKGTELSDFPKSMRLLFLLLLACIVACEGGSDDDFIHDLKISFMREAEGSGNLIPMLDIFALRDTRQRNERM
jgi:hypothetical protein